MIEFKTLTYCNFLSVGNTPIEIDFTSTRSTLIVGHNGSGKSLMLDALSYALFGKPHRPINKPQLVNSINCKGCLVTIEFSIGSKEYRIIRGMKPGIFEIWVNGILLNQDSHSRDYQKLLETNILKLNHKGFHQVVVLGGSNFVPFMQLSAGARRDVIEDLLDIKIFSKMNNGLKEAQSKLKEQIQYTEYEIKVIKEKIALQNSHIDNLKNIHEDSTNKLDDEIKEMTTQVAVLVENNQALTEDYQKDYASTNELNVKNQKNKSKLETFERQINGNIKKVLKEKSFFEKVGSCPTCDQVISDDIRDQKVHECSHQLMEYKKGYEKLKDSIREAENKLKATQNKLNDLIEVNKELSSNSALISNYEKRIVELNNQKNLTSTSSDLEQAKKDRQKFYEKKNEFSDKKSNQTEEQHYNEIIGELLKDTGIKTKIIKQYLPVMNKLINHYLQILDFFVLFNLDENFNETIRSRHRDDFSYSSFSEGEKQRIDLSLLFAWRKVAKMKNSANTNLLILDEVFDASLDTDGIDNLLKIMNALDAETRIFVISHKQELLESRFDRKIEFECRRNFTKIKSIS